MKLACIAVICALAAGCSHTQANVDGGASFNARVHNNAVAALLISGMFLAAAAEGARDPRPLPSFATFADWFRGTPRTPAMDPNRVVIEQDCNGPIDPTVTLKCR